MLSLASSGVTESEPGRSLPEIEWKELVLDLENVLGTGAFVSPIRCVAMRAHTLMLGNCLQSQVARGNSGGEAIEGH